jgi:hypothetical protein
VLLATPNLVTDGDQNAGAVTYQWQCSADGITWNNIIGASASSYILARRAYKVDALAGIWLANLRSKDRRWGGCCAYSTCSHSHFEANVERALNNGTMLPSV